MSGVFIIESAVLVTASAWLWVRIRRRMNSPQPEEYWTGHGIDVHSVTERVQKVRRDYAAALKNRHGYFYSGGDLLAAVRKIIRKASYFRSQKERDSTTGQHQGHADTA